MPEFKVLWTETVYKSCVIEAEDEDDARSKFWEDDGRLNGEVEDEETNEITHVYEVKP